MLPGLGGSDKRRLRQTIMIDTALVITEKLVRMRQVARHAQPKPVATV